MAPFQRQSQDQSTVLEHMCGLDIYSEPYTHRQVRSVHTQTVIALAILLTPDVLCAPPA